MEVFLDIGRLLFGGLVLYLGAEWLVKGSAGLARAFGVKPLVIGLTVVAYGTSAPELAVSVSAQLDGKSDIVLGNIIGSCIANLGLILGLTALLKPPEVDGRLIRREVPILVGSALVVPAVLWSGAIGWIEALVMVLGSIGFTAWTLLSEASVNAPTGEEAEESAEAGGAPGGSGRLRMTAVTIIGLGLLIGGGEVFVDGAIGVARAMDVSERFIAMTIIAVGTSLPELAASAVAAMRGHSDLAVGNVVGSNIFNVLLILGVVPLISPVEGALGDLRYHLYFLVGLTVFGALAMRGQRRISRAEGGLLFAAYAAFVGVAFVQN